MRGGERKAWRKEREREVLCACNYKSYWQGYKSNWQAVLILNVGWELGGRRGRVTERLQSQVIHWRLQECVVCPAVITSEEPVSANHNFTIGGSSPPPPL